LLERQTDNIREGTVDARNDPPAAALRGVAARFVERIDLANVSGDVAFVERTKGDVRYLGEEMLTRRGDVAEANGRADLMSAPA
jgi:hypothetical protein